MVFLRKKENRISKIAITVMFLCMVIMSVSQTAEAKVPSNFYLNFCSDEISTEYDYSSKITFHGNKVTIKGYLTLKDNEDNVLGKEKMYIKNCVKLFFFYH